MKTELERCKEALEAAMIALRDAKNRGGTLWASCTYVLDNIEAILNPPPEMEEVEVKAWKHATFGDLTEEAETAAKWGAEAIELTGTYKRPVPRKVERSRAVKAMYTSLNGSLSATVFIPTEAIGKPTTITVAWEEEGAST